MKHIILHHKYFPLLTVLLLFFLLPAAHAQKENKWIRKGNSAFAKGDYDNAEIGYRKALDKNAQNTKAQFNLGDALYAKQDFEKAAESFATAEQMKDADKVVDKSTLYYNRGNALLKANKLDESIAAYKQSLLQNPNNKDARYNLQYALLKKKQQEQQQKNQDKNQQNKDNKDKKDQDKNKDNKDKDKQNKDKKDQNKDQKDKDKQNQDKKDDKQNKKDQDKNKDQKDKDKQDQQNKPNKSDKKDQQGQQNNNTQPQRQKQKISKQDAEKMLQALKNNEKKTLDKLKKAKAGTAVKSDKDW